MAPTQGFLASLTLDGTDYTTITVTTPLTRSKGLLNKATMNGSGDMESIPGLSSGSISVAGFLDEPLHNTLEATWAKDDPISFTLTVERGLTTDAQWFGLVTLTSLTVEPTEDGLWAFSLSGETSGSVVYVPSAV